ncbi:MAG: hypothetical protein WBD70_19590 [Mycobacterium sp.]
MQGCTETSIERNYCASRALTGLREVGFVDSDLVDQEFDHGQLLPQLTGVVAVLNTHAPEIAAVLYPGLNVLKDHVDDPDLRAAAVSELSAGY